MTSTQKTELNYDEFYNEDFYSWVKITAKLLREKRFNEIDLDNLIDEVETLGRSERKAIKSNLKVLLMHLLKYQYQPEKRSKSWLVTIKEHRQRLQDDLKDSRSLKPYFQEIFTETYQQARELAALETDLPLEIFPLEFPFTPEQTLDYNYLPES